MSLAVNLVSIGGCLLAIAPGIIEAKICLNKVNKKPKEPKKPILPKDFIIPKYFTDEDKDYWSFHVRLSKTPIDELDIDTFMPSVTIEELNRLDPDWWLTVLSDKELEEIEAISKAFDLSMDKDRKEADDAFIQATKPNYSEYESYDEEGYSLAQRREQRALIQRGKKRIKISENEKLKPFVVFESFTMLTKVTKDDLRNRLTQEQVTDYWTKGNLKFL